MKGLTRSLNTPHPRKGTAWSTPALAEPETAYFASTSVHHTTDVAVEAFLDQRVPLVHDWIN